MQVTIVTYQFNLPVSGGWSHGQLIFPEIEYDKVDKIRGMDIIFVTTAETDEEARELLRLLGMPYAS